MNIGSGERITVEELAIVIRDEIDQKLNIIHDEAREGDAEHTHADMTNTINLLDYNPLYQSKTGHTSLLSGIEIIMNGMIRLCVSRSLDPKA